VNKALGMIRLRRGRFEECGSYWEQRGCGADRVQMEGLEENEERRGWAGERHFSLLSLSAERSVAQRVTICQ
jgi:hypothetical protein